MKGTPQGVPFSRRDVAYNVSAAAASVTGVEMHPTGDVASYVSTIAETYFSSGLKSSDAEFMQ